MYRISSKSFRISSCVYNNILNNLLLQTDANENVSCSTFGFTVLSFIQFCVMQTFTLRVGEIPGIFIFRIFLSCSKKLRLELAHPMPGSHFYLLFQNLVHYHRFHSNFRITLYNLVNLNIHPSLPI